MALNFRIAFGGFKELTPEDLEFARQIGVAGIAINRPDFDSQAWRRLLGKHHPYGPGELGGAGRWQFMDLLNLRTYIEGFGLRLEAIENTPYSFYDKALVGAPGCEEQIDAYCESIRNLGRAGIKILGYHWSPNLVWRTAHAEPGRGGAGVTSYDHALARAAPPTHGRRISEEENWASYERFITRVLPVAEEAGVRLALHPDDPPVAELGGIPRIMRNLEGFQKAMSIGDSPNHGLNFCVGTWAEMGVDRMFEAMEHFGRRGKLTYVHFRNVKGAVPKFSECFLDEGDVDIVRALGTLRDVGFDGFLFDDHVPHVVNDTVWGHRSRAYATGMIRGICMTLELKA